MATKEGSDQPQKGNAETDDTRQSGSHARSDCCDDWRYCEPPSHCWPPYWDPYCGPHPYQRRHHRHHGGYNHWPMPPMPGSEFFEAMMQFAASAAGSRGRWWRGMADAARYARNDYMCGDPCYDPCAPHHSYCDPCPPYWSYCDPCEPRHCDPCEWPYERRSPREEPDPINIKELRATLEAARATKLQELQNEINKIKDPEKAGKLAHDLAVETAKTEAAIDAVIHDVKLARVTEAMRRKQWSRGGRGERPC
jgi:hypothetical protein